MKTAITALLLVATTSGAAASYIPEEAPQKAGDSYTAPKHESYPQPAKDESYKPEHQEEAKHEVKYEQHKPEEKTYEAPMNKTEAHQPAPYEAEHKPEVKAEHKSYEAPAKHEPSKNATHPDQAPEAKEEEKKEGQYHHPAQAEHQPAKHYPAAQEKKEEEKPHHAPHQEPHKPEKNEAKKAQPASQKPAEAGYEVAREKCGALYTDIFGYRVEHLLSQVPHGPLQDILRLIADLVKYFIDSFKGKGHEELGKRCEAVVDKAKEIVKDENVISLLTQACRELVGVHKNLAGRNVTTQEYGMIESAWTICKDGYAGNNATAATNTTNSTGYAPCAEPFEHMMRGYINGTDSPAYKKGVEELTKDDKYPTELRKSVKEMNDTIVKVQSKEDKDEGTGNSATRSFATAGLLAGVLALFL